MYLQASDELLRVADVWRINLTEKATLMNITHGMLCVLDVIVRMTLDINGIEVGV